MPDTTVTTRMLYLGKTDEGNRVWARIELRHGKPGGETVTHDHIDQLTEMSFQHEEIDPRIRRDGGLVSCGAGLPDAIDRITEPAPGWPVAELRELGEIAERWHMNTLNAGCAHQTVVYETNPRYGYRQPSLTLTEPCPETGYRYGHAWLVEEVPADVLDTVRHLVETHADALFLERGYDGGGKRYPASA